MRFAFESKLDLLCFYAWYDFIVLYISIEVKRLGIMTKNCLGDVYLYVTCMAASKNLLFFLFS